MIRALLAWGPAALWAAVLWLLSSVPDVPGSSWLAVVPGGDKLVHAALYAVLGALLAFGRRRWGRVPHLALILVGVLYGLSDEWHQSFVPGRFPSAADWVADLIGVGLGYGIACLLPRPGGEPRRTPREGAA